MIQNIICFVFGMYLGQEYPNEIPNIREKTLEFLKEWNEKK